MGKLVLEKCPIVADILVHLGHIGKVSVPDLVSRLGAKRGAVSLRLSRMCEASVVALSGGRPTYAGGAAVYEAADTPPDWAAAHIAEGFRGLTHAIFHLVDAHPGHNVSFTHWNLPGPGIVNYSYLGSAIDHLEAAGVLAREYTLHPRYTCCNPLPEEWQLLRVQLQLSVGPQPPQRSRKA